MHVISFSHLFEVMLLSYLTVEAQALGTMMVAFGYIYPLQDHKRLVIKSDASLYRFQVTFMNLSQTVKILLYYQYF